MTLRVGASLCNSPTSLVCAHKSSACDDITYLICHVLCYVMWNLSTFGSLQFPNDSTIASLEAKQNLMKPCN